MCLQMGGKKKKKRNEKEEEKSISGIVASIHLIMLKPCKSYKANNKTNVRETCLQSALKLVLYQIQLVIIH